MTFSSFCYWQRPIFYVFIFGENLSFDRFEEIWCFFDEDFVCFSLQKSSFSFLLSPFRTWWNWWGFSMLVKIHFSWKSRNVMSILLLNQNLVVSLCRSFSFRCKMLMVEIKDVDFVISIETGPLFWFSP
jgi:hypothetical protein